MKKKTDRIVIQSPKAPRRFQVIDENTWIGSPSIFYGVVRRLAYEKRRKRTVPYLRVLFGEAGRRGDPWGGLALEVNGDLFHFTAGVRRWPQFHDGSGNLTTEGQKSLAEGVPGFLSTDCDWRWVQDEVDLTEKLTSSAIEQIASCFCGLRGGLLPLPMFQARRWAERNGVAIKPGQQNCTTIILEQLATKGVVINESMPLPAIDALQNLAGGSQRSFLDDELNHLLNLSESEIQTKLKIVAFLNEPLNEPIDWSGIAKGVAPIPAWLSWSSLKV